MSKKTIALGLSFMLLLALGLTGCGGEKKDAAKTAEAKILRVGSDTAYAPFEFQDEQSKEYVGFDMELIRAIGKQMGREVKISSMGFDGLIPALEAGSWSVYVPHALTWSYEHAEKPENHPRFREIAHLGDLNETLRNLR